MIVRNSAGEVKQVSSPGLVKPTPVVTQTITKPKVVESNMVEKSVNFIAPAKKELADASVYVPQPLINYIKRPIDKQIAFWCELDKETNQPRKTVTLIGESGSGKNYSVTNYASEMGLPMLTVPCDDSQVLKELLGFWKATNGTTVWCEGLLPQFLRQPSTILFDEVNCLPAAKCFMLHELIQNRKLFVKDAPAELSTVELHPETRIFIAINPPEAKYSGTNRLNAALANRCVFVEVKPFTDAEILTVKTGNDTLDSALVQFYRETSRIIKEQKLRISISKRNVDTIATAIKHGLDVGSAVMQGFVNSALATASPVERDVLMNTAILVFGASKFESVIKP